MLKFSGLRRLEKSRFFPYFTRFKRDFKYLALVGLGSNIASEKQRFDKLFRVMMDDKRLKILSSSVLLVNEAFGFKEQKDFTNAVMLVQTNLHARAFLKILLYYELKFKRKRTFKNAPRTLDLDLLYFSRKTKQDAWCAVPHSGAKERLSVILPLGLMQGI